MTSGLVRVYAILAAVVVFFVTWAAVAAQPWREATADPRVAALEARRAHLQLEAARVQRILDERHAAYRAALVPRVVEMPAVVSTHSS
jgi:hypothetical protein